MQTDPSLPENPQPGTRNPEPGTHRSGYVALVGAPNVGKSTLLNRLVGSKLAIVTPKPSTTRHRILGIFSTDDAQVIFVDTPGVVRPRYRLHEAMMRNVDRALTDADVTIFLADATVDHLTHDARAALKKLERYQGMSILALNKMDLLGQQKEALPLVELYSEHHAFDEVVPISAKNGDGVDILMELVLGALPEGPAYYPKDQLSEHPERFFVAEIVREAVFYQFRQEVPYSTSVVVVQYDERESKKDFIACDIVVERDSQKAILIGKKGAALKRLGAAARREIEAFTGRPVYLKLHVKTRADWRNRPGHLREYGYR